MSKTPWLIKLVRPTYGKWLLHHWGVKCEGYEKIPKKGPFLVIGNHTHTYDAMFLSASTPFHIHWVMGAYLFKNRFLNYVFDSLIKGIPKQQGKSDIYTIRGIKKVLAENGIVGFFPEGTRTWDGESIPINDATAKMIRLFNVPVVIFHFEGAYAVKPRWSRQRRKGPLTLHVVKVLHPEDFKGKSVGYVAALVNSYLIHSYESWQQEYQIPYLSDTMAEGIENIFYACPSCFQFSTIRSTHKTFECSSCHSKWELNEFDEIHPLENSPSYPSIASWHQWERSVLEQLILTHDQTPLFQEDDGVLFQYAPSKQLILLSKDFTITATQDAFILSINSFKEGQSHFDKKKIIFEFENITSIVINAKSTLEFSYLKKIYRIRIKQNQSILKYMELYQIQQSLNLKESV